MSDNKADARASGTGATGGESGGPDAKPSRRNVRVPKFRRRAEARPDEVLDAALDLFIEKGFAATRVEDIAKRAGLSKGAVYLYFNSKQAILEALVRRVILPSAGDLAHLLETWQGTSREAIESLFAMLLNKAHEPRALAIPKLVIREVANFPDLGRMYREEVIEQVKPLIVEVVKRGIASGEFRPVDPDLTMRSIVGPLAMHLVVADLFGLVPEGGLRVNDLLQNHFTILFDGLTNPEDRQDG